MQAVIRYPDAQRVEAAVLSAGRFTMRIVPVNADDAVELTLHCGQWFDESGTPVEFESFVIDDEDDVRYIVQPAMARAAAS